MKVIMEKELLKNVMNAMTRYSDSQVNEMTIDMVPGSVILTSTDSTSQSIIILALGKEMLAGYDCKEERKIVLTVEDAKEIADFCMVCIKGDEDRTKAVSRKNRLLKANVKKTNKGLKAKEKKLQTVLIEAPKINDITLEFDAQEVRMSMGQLKRSLQLSSQEDTESGKKAANTTTRLYPSLTKIGELPKDALEEVLNYMRAGASFEGKQDRVVTIVKDDERFEIETEVDDNDFVILDLKPVLKKQTKDNLRMKLQTRNIYRALKMVRALTDRAVLLGSTDFPLMICRSGRSPETATKFKDPLDFWYMLAPRIEAE